MEKFFEIISQLTILDDESIKALSQIMIKLELPKGHILVEPNSICNHVYFIEKGLTRTFYYKKGKDVTDWFYPENTFASSIVSFITRKPDRRGIELLESSLICSFHFNELEDLFNKHHAIERLGRKLVSKGMVEIQKRFDDLHFSTALQRYKMLLEVNPRIINRAPLGMVASYLGITQETLSRIRRPLPR
ncbi:MAG: Crp/Fnr family transcriptional regulator [Bacteroidetes bacterium]|nr:Crp/Fnr family transcriptional regulator [Bacteroidota bacterium]